MGEKKSAPKDLRQRDLSSFESVKSTLEQIEEGYVVPEDYKPVILKLIEEYFWLKEHAAPSTVAAKWTELEKTLDALELKAKK